jgi:hypothetical protein
MAIARENNDHNTKATWQQRLTQRILARIGGGWRPRSETPPAGRVWASDGKTVWWIWTDGKDIPDTATSVLYWMLFPVPDPPPPPQPLNGGEKHGS